MSRLEALVAGMAVPFGGDRVTTVPRELAEAFTPGDRLVVVQSDGALLHIPAAVADLVAAAVADATHAFAALARCGDDQISLFFDRFAQLLADDETFAEIARANAADVADAQSRGRSTTRLVLSERMRADMVAGLTGWRDSPVRRDALVETVTHAGWRVEQRRAPLGPVGFVFEGRPNVFADATGVLRSGNTVVFRIGSDALGTARAIVACALAPALAHAGLPPGAVRLLDTASRAAGWALFSDQRVALAVARGSGEAVAQLGSVARQAGVPVSLHGTGGAWLIAGRGVHESRFVSAVRHSLDRKVCNTLNVCCVLADHAATVVPAFLGALRAAAGARGTNPKLHVTAAARTYLDSSWLDSDVVVHRADGARSEPLVELIEPADLGTEWEWEESPEVSLAVVASLEVAVALCNRYSPRLVASLISDDSAEQEEFWASVDSPFVGNGFTRWVDGQYALGRPELGLSNWQGGRLFSRGGVLSGDSVFTVRTRAVQTDPDVHR